MAKLQIRVIPEGNGLFKWLIVDHVWDGISAPIAVSPDSYGNESEALLMGATELRRIEDMPARDHPLQD